MLNDLGSDPDEFLNNKFPLPWPEGMRPPRFARMAGMGEGDLNGKCSILFTLTPPSPVKGEGVFDFLKHVIPDPQSS